MKTQYGDKVVFASRAPRTESAQTGRNPEAKEKSYNFDFNLKPKDIKAHLDRFVIKQDDAKKVLCIAVCDHYNHVKQAERGEAIAEYTKQNVMLIGPTGVGQDVSHQDASPT